MTGPESTKGPELEGQQFDREFKTKASFFLMAGPESTERGPGIRRPTGRQRIQSKRFFFVSGFLREGAELEGQQKDREYKATYTTERRKVLSGKQARVAIDDHE